MRTLLLIISFALFSFLPSAYSQTFYAQTGTPQAGKGNPVIGANIPKQPTIGKENSLFAFINYYLSESALSASFVGSQKQLINSKYSYPADTSNTFNTKNYYCINAISVAFDTIPGLSTDTIAQTIIDTLFLPIIQVNHSGLNDTLEIQLTTVDLNGYPYTNTYVVDTLIIDTNHGHNSIGAGNDFTVNLIKWSLGSHPLIGGRFAINVTYHDSTKMDSCWFIYGYSSFSRACPYESSTNTFANMTKFSRINALPKQFYANSFAQWNEYTGLGYFPTANGNNVFYPCTASDTTSYHPGIDGANYLQDIDMAVQVLYTSFTGIQNLHSTEISVSQNYPNPFNNTSVINYNLAKQGDVSLKINDLAGREIMSQNYSSMNPGQHTIMLNANSFSSGVYFYSITSSGYTISRKMVVY